MARIAKGDPLVTRCERGSKAYYVGNAKVRTATAQAPDAPAYVRPRDAGLLPDVELAQAFEVTPQEFKEEPSPEQEMGPLPCRDEGGPELTEKETKSWQEVETYRKKSTLHEAMEERLPPERTPSSTNPNSISRNTPTSRRPEGQFGESN